MSISGGKANEDVFQNEIIRQMQADGWLLGQQSGYDRDLALYSEDLIAFVKETQDTQWQKLVGHYGDRAETKLLERVVSQLKKADPNAIDVQMRKFGTLGVLRHGIKDRGASIKLCQFQPDHKLNPDTLAKYKQNRLRVVPELVYSPYCTDAHFAETGTKSKKWRIDLVLFVNGLPIATLELKSEFKQSVQNAVTQYKKTRLSKDPATRKPEPLLSFKRGALVHFAVSQYEVYMTTKLAGGDTFFLPFNKGTKEGGAGNDVPENPNEYATSYLWKEVLQPDALLNILQRFMHLQIENKEDWQGEKYKKETMIFPRYHQWDVVEKLLSAAKEEGPGNKYLVQHSAGSGKSNSIAWTAHQLSSLYTDAGDKAFDSVIIVTDRTVLDDQLQETISQFEHTEGVVGKINRKEGDGSKSEKLAKALETSQPIIIVTIQTFPYVLKAIEDSVSLKERKYAVIADEAHSSQTGATARKLKEVLMVDTNDKDEELSADDVLNAVLAARKASSNLSYFAFTATPKSKTLELFGRVPNPTEVASEANKPQAYHVYSMRQAIEEKFILDVLRNYTSYKTAYQLSLKIKEADTEVDAQKAKVKLNQWVRLNDHNIGQKVMVIAEHFKDNVKHLLDGQAKAMIVTSSRKEAVKYKRAFDKYIHSKAGDVAYDSIEAMVAFSGEVTFAQGDPDAAVLAGEKFTEASMNTKLNGRDMREAFDTEEYQVMIVANKFQTGFDQPKLCAMYVDKKLNGVDCVQTLSRLNRTYPGKEISGTFVLDFFNDPDDVLKSFQEYYQTAELIDVSDPNAVYDLSEKLQGSQIFQWHEVEQFFEFYFQKNKSNAAISNICKPAVERWTQRYKSAVAAYKDAQDMLARAKRSKDAVIIANADNSFKACKVEKDALEMFKKDLGSFVRFYEFISQIVDFDDKDLEKLSMFARHLGPLLRETNIEEDSVDLNNVELSHYRLSKVKQQNLGLSVDAAEGLKPGSDIGSGTAKDKQEEFLSLIIQRLNEVFAEDELTEDDLVNYATTISDKMRENLCVMSQIKNNTKDQAMLGDFEQAMEDAILDSNDVHKKQMNRILSMPDRGKVFAGILYDLLMSDDRN